MFVRAVRGEVGEGEGGTREEKVLGKFTRKVFICRIRMLITGINTAHKYALCTCRWFCNSWITVIAKYY